jgi:hypothetical protein
MKPSTPNPAAPAMPSLGNDSKTRKAIELAEECPLKLFGFSGDFGG